MKRQINRENWAGIENKFVKRTWTFSEEETDETPASYTYWNIANNRIKFDQDKDVISVETFVNKYDEGFHRVSSNNLPDFLSQRDAIKMSYPGSDREASKTFVLLNEAGSGKTTYLKWLAHELFQGHSTRWIVMLKLIECSFVFSKYKKKKKIDQTAALRLLFQLFYMAFLAPNVNSKDIEYAKAANKKAQNCAKVLTISNGAVELDGTKLDLIMNLNYTFPDTSRMVVLLRIFRLKFNRKILFLLMDGFDEIAPIYLEPAFPLLSEIDGFEGICKLYLTSRPYGFRQDFKQVLKKCLFYRLDKFDSADILHYTYRFASNNWKKLSEDNRVDLVGVLNVLTRKVLGDLGVIPLFLAIALELLQKKIDKYVDFEAGQISPGLMQECSNMFEPRRMMETFVRKKLDINNLDKTSANVGIISASIAVMMREAAYKKNIRIHSILAMYHLFDEETTRTLLSDDMKNKALKYMKKIQNGTEKSGIIEGVVASKPLFIHRLFAEYFAALWLFSNYELKGVKEFVQELMYGKNRKIKEVRYFLNRLICSASPMHLAILDCSNEKIEELLRTNKECINKKDVWGRTPLHLAFGEGLARENVSYVEERLKVLLETTDATNIDAKDKYFGWSTLFYAGLCFLHTDSYFFGEQDIKFAQLNSDDPVKIFYYALSIEMILPTCFLSDRYFTIYIFQPLFKCIARQLINEKHFDLHSPMQIIDDPAWNELTKSIEALRQCNLYARTPLECCVRFDSLMLEQLVVAAGGPEKIRSSFLPDIFDIACEHKSMIVLWYLIIDCKIQPSINNLGQVMLFLWVYMSGDKKMFRVLFHKYCKEYEIACLDEDQLRELIDENDQNTFDTFRNRKHFWLTEYPREKGLLTNGIDAGTYFLLVMALSLDEAPISKYLIQKTGIAIDIDFITNLLSILKDLGKEWSCSFHFLLDNIKNLHGEEENGRNLLHIACTRGWFFLMKCLIEHFSFDALLENKKENNWNAFFYCTTRFSMRSNEIVDYLIDNFNMDCYGKLDSDGKSVFYYAVKNGTGMDNLIISNQFDVGPRYLSNEQITRLTNHMKTSGFDIWDMIGYLEYNGLINALSLKTVCSTLQITEDSVFGDEGRNFLHIACTGGWINLVKCLIEHCNFNALRENEKENNWNAFFYSTLWNRTDIFTYLFEKCETDCFGKIDSRGQSVFNYALKGHGRIACYIMNKDLIVKNLILIPEQSACLLKRLEEANVTKEDFCDKLKKIQYRPMARLRRNTVDLQQILEILSYSTS